MLFFNRLRPSVLIPFARNFLISCAGLLKNETDRVWRFVCIMVGMNRGEAGKQI
jgi:hypothetical protein